MSQQPQQIRLNKFLAERLGVSRREADELIVSGKIRVDSEIAKIGTKIDNKSKVLCNDKLVPFDTSYTYLAFYKPTGYVCSRHAQGDTPTIYKLLPQKYYELKTVGRLDKDSSGLILLTNDGDFAFQMTHPKFRKTKIYEVELDHELEPLHQQMISDYGVMLDDGVSRFKVIKNSFDNSSINRYIVFLTEGRNRQIRRTFAALGYHVVGLHRTCFGKYELGDMKPGDYRVITR